MMFKKYYELVVINVYACILEKSNGNGNLTSRSEKAAKGSPTQEPVRWVTSNAMPALEKQPPQGRI